MRTEVEVSPEIEDLVSTFVTNRSLDLAKIESCMEQGQHDEILRICHRIKGVATPYGFPTMGTLVLQLDRSCRAGLQAEMRSDLSALKKYLDQYLN